MTPVCLGMPVYNGMPYLKEALTTLSAQDFDGLKILISDNASTDATPDLLSDFSARDPRIVWHRQKENIGAVRNYAWVLENSQSPWFAFAAHDDAWSPNFVSLLYAAAIKRPHATLSVPRVVTMDIDGLHGTQKPFKLDVDLNAPPARRIGAALKAAHPSWFHGLAARTAFDKAWDWSRQFPHVWGIDPMLVLPLILADGITGDDRAIFYRRETGLSDQRYRPKTVRSHLHVTGDFWRLSLKALAETPLSMPDKIRLLPALAKYNRQVGKWRRAVKLALKGQW